MKSSMALVVTLGVLSAFGRSSRAEDVPTPLASVAEVSSAREVLGLVLQSRDPAKGWTPDQIKRVEAQLGALPLAHLVAVAAEPGTRADPVRKLAAERVIGRIDEARPLILRAIALSDPREPLSDTFQSIVVKVARSDSKGEVEAAWMAKVDACYRTRVTPIGPAQGLNVTGTKKCLPGLYKSLVITSLSDPATTLMLACRGVLYRIDPKERDEALKPLGEALAGTTRPGKGVAEAARILAMTGSDANTDALVHVLDVIERGDFGPELNALAPDCINAVAKALLNIRTEKAVARVLRSLDLTVTEVDRRMAALSALTDLKFAPHVGEATAGHMFGKRAVPQKPNPKVITRLAEALADSTRSDDEKQMTRTVLRTITAQNFETADEWRRYAQTLPAEK